ncbi:hypothetical protein [Spirillospora sp. NPDC047279]|uniref:hypothetical protein n=1 Tax=Spirillospora sp. NPDC047279 TaxID=3155478 RepID=UPI0033DC81D6
MEATTMGSLFDELARREAVVRQRIEEISEQIAELAGLLEAEEDWLSRLAITWETVREVVVRRLERSRIWWLSPALPVRVWRRPRRSGF